MSLSSEADFSNASDYMVAEKLNKRIVHPTKSVSFKTLGCRLNQSETSVLARTFEQQGYRVVPDTESADVCVVNTCTVTEHSDAKNRQAIRTLHRLNPEAMIAVVGCYAQIDPEAIAKIDGVQLVIGSEEKMRLADYLAQAHAAETPLIIRPKINKNTFTAPIVPHNSVFFAKKTRQQINTLEHDNESAISLAQSKDTLVIQNTRASLKIQDGCDFMCTFCIIPFARGRSRYRDFLNLQEEASMLVKEGVREIVITGVNVGTYQTGKFTIVDVIDFLNNLSGLLRIRISSIEPTTVPEILFQYMNDKQHKLVPFFHLPLQSGADEILKKMKRRYSAAEYADDIWRAFESVPDLSIGTDVMVGFPQENEIEFQETLNLLDNLPLTYFHVFPFSARKGTPAFQLKDKIPPQIKQQRSEILRELSTKKRRNFNKRFLGQIRNVLWESRRPNGEISGYTDNFIRVVLDGIDGNDLRNQLLPVKLKLLKGQTMLGEFA